MSKEHWDNSFSDADYVYGETANVFIQDKSELIPNNATIGCFAEGEGRNAVYLAKLGYHVTAFDQSAVGLEKTKALAAKNQVDVQTAQFDLTREKVPKNQFDAAIMVFGHVSRQDQPFFIRNILDAVKPDGYVIFEVYSEDQLDYGTGGPSVKEMLYDPKDILQWIEDHKCLHFYYGEAYRQEGKKHSGACHLIQVVIKK
ncbi:class I SAM-dependent methyltransferase [Virgibacillus halophilus]|uniref:class I SAM-dependent methyltransferase n=1 Tax=Tigheibacillus halophilus TaxID=361280 RepID=UPI00363254FF